MIRHAAMQHAGCHKVPTHLVRTTRKKDVSEREAKAVQKVVRIAIGYAAPRNALATLRRVNQAHTVIPECYSSSSAASKPAPGMPSIPSPSPTILSPGPA